MGFCCSATYKRHLRLTVLRISSILSSRLRMLITQRSRSAHPASTSAAGRAASRTSTSCQRTCRLSTCRPTWTGSRNCRAVARRPPSAPGKHSTPPSTASSWPSSRIRKVSVWGTCPTAPLAPHCVSLKIWKTLRPREVMQNQHTRELITTWKTSHTHTQQQRPGSPMVTVTWHASQYKVHKLHQRYILKDARWELL